MFVLMETLQADLALESRYLIADSRWSRVSPLEFA